MIENFAVYPSRLGDIKITYTDKAITGIELSASGFDRKQAMPSGLSESAIEQLNEYFTGKREEFDLPLAPSGTPFQQKVWAELKKIPYGQTRSYKDIAHAVGSDNAYRAVGMANNKNPIAIVIPCHRVIGSDGSLTGYAGGIDIKKSLLDLEAKYLTAENN